MSRFAYYVHTMSTFCCAHIASPCSALGHCMHTHHSQAAGYSCVEDAADADVLVYNTCSIRDKAEQKVYSALGRQVGTKGYRDLSVSVGLSLSVLQRVCCYPHALAPGLTDNWPIRETVPVGGGWLPKNWPARQIRGTACRPV